MMHKTSGAATETLWLSVGPRRLYSVDFVFYFKEGLLEDYIWTASYVTNNMETSLWSYIGSVSQLLLVKMISDLFSTQSLNKSFGMIRFLQTTDMLNLYAYTFIFWQHCGSGLVR